MSTKKVRVNTILNFDEQQESDIINVIKKMQDGHRIGEFLANVIRIAMDTPEIIKIKDNNYVKGDALRDIENNGKTPERVKNSEEMFKAIKDMQDKVDKMYDMILKMYTMLEFGKRLGIEEKIKNQILAEFSIEQQIERMVNEIGIDCRRVPFASNRIHHFEEKSAEYLDYIISCYEPVVNSLKDSLTVVSSNNIVNNDYKPLMNVEVPRSEVVSETIMHDKKVDDNKSLNIKPVDLVIEDDLDNDAVEFKPDNFGQLLDFFGD